MPTQADTAPARDDSAATSTLFVLGSRLRGGFHASIRGQILELARPDSGHKLAPTPADLLIASIASDFAWSAQTFLRVRGLPDDVSVCGTWQILEDPPRLASIDLTVTVSNSAETNDATLIAALENSFAARSLKAPLCVRIRGGYGL